MIEMNIDNISKVEAISMLKELEKIPLYDVTGGRQRSSRENETFIKLLAIIRKDDG